MKLCKRIISTFLVAVMLISAAPLDGFVELGISFENPFKIEADALTNWTVDNYNESMFIADVWSNRTGDFQTVEDLINYFSVEAMSPCGTFVDSIFADKGFVEGLIHWEMTKLAADPSAALGTIVKREDYCEIVIFDAINMTLGDTAFSKLYSNDVIKYSKEIIGGIADVLDVNQDYLISETFDLTDTETQKSVSEALKNTKFGKIKDIEGVASQVISYGFDILKFADTLAQYAVLTEIDTSLKNCLNHLYDICPISYTAMKSALANITRYFDGFLGSMSSAMYKALEVGADWTVSLAIKTGLSSVTAANPILAAFFTGLNLGVLFSNILFATDDVYEQIYIMEKMVQFEKLVKECMNDMKSTYTSNPNETNADNYRKSVELFFNTISKVNCECTIKLYDNLFNKGLIDQLKNGFGKFDNAADVKATLNTLSDGRKYAYSMINNFCLKVLREAYPEIYIAFGYEKIESDYVALEKIDLRNILLDTPDLRVGESMNIMATYTPANTTELGFKLISSNENILRIAESQIIGVSPGTVTVTMVSLANPDITDTFEIVVGESDGENDETQNNSLFTYTVNNGTATITGLNSDEVTDLIIPSYINGYRVTSIGEEAFLDSYNLTSVEIPGSVTSIGWSAFSYCENLTCIKVSESVTNIDCFAFANCSKLKSIEIPHSISTISDGMFEDCDSLTEIRIPENTTSVGRWAFAFCDNLIDIEISDSVTSISPDAFIYTAYYNDENNWDDGALYIDNCLIEVVDVFGDYRVKHGTRLIADSVLLNYRYVTGIEIPSSVIHIGNGALSGRGLSYIKVDEENPEYSSDENGVLFNKDKTKIIQYPIGNGRQEYLIPDSVTSIGDSAFAYCDSLTSVEIGNSVINISNYAFRNCTSLTSIKIPDSVSVIGESAFADCDSLASITIPDNVTSIGVGAFFYCTSLTSITIPDSVTSIGYCAFEYCDNLTDIYFEGTQEKWERIFIDSYNEPLYNATIHFNSTMPEFHTHSYTSAITTPATCTTNGVKTFTCTADNCGATYTEVVVATNAHVFGGEYRNVDTDGDGKNESHRQFCQNGDPNCTAYLDTAHTYEDDTDANCNVCGEEREVETHTHLYSSKVTKSATCTTSGVKTFTCYCGDSYTEAIPATGHNSDTTIPAVSATCTATGLTEGKKCSACGTITVAQLTVSKKPHTSDNGTITKSATCAAAGTKTYKCTVCDTVVNTETISATGHNSDTTIPVVPSTCTSTGFTEGKKCSVCGTITVAQQTVPKKNHIYDNDTDTTCNVCGEVREVEVHKHNYTSKVTKTANCTTAGVKTYSCDCGDSYTETIQAIGHNSNTTIPAVAATCTSTGKTAGKKCTVCGTITVAQKTVAKTVHNSNTTIPAVTATYTSEGLTAGKKCSVCGTVTMAQKTVAKLALGKVEDLKAKKIKVAKSSEITLSWTSLGEGVKYEVYQKNGKKWKKLKTTSSTSYTVKKLKADKEYKFRVRAVVDGVKGKYSSTLTVKTIPATTTLKLNAGKKQLTASWSKVSDISGYEIQYSTSKKFTKKTTKTSNVKKSSKKTTIKKLSKGKKYYVRIRTYKTVNGKKIFSSWSKVKNVKVK